MHLEEVGGKAVLVCTVGKTVLHYEPRWVDDLHGMLKKHGDWMELGSADEQKPAKEGTVEAWGRLKDNPIGGWYGDPCASLDAVVDGAGDRHVGASFKRDREVSPAGASVRGDRPRGGGRGRDGDAGPGTQADLRA
jgi:hypothetical protein